MSDPNLTQQVQQFYNQVGWQRVGEDTYQNARYEDLRPVAREYIHRCHLRVSRHLKPHGRFLLDAGSGPVQYEEYLAYSQGYHQRVCLDISIVALQEARKRLGEHGLYVVADVSCLPFKPGVFEGLVSLHTLHHLPAAGQELAYGELYRVMAPGSTAVVVNGWTDSALMRRCLPLVRLYERLGSWFSPQKQAGPQPAAKKASIDRQPVGTYVHKLDATWLSQVLSQKGIPFEIRVWRSVSVRFLRALIHAPLAGRLWLRLLFWLEDRFPHWFGEKGQYPLIVIKKP